MHNFSDVVEQLAEYWDSGLTIPEYCEIKELSYESTHRWIAALKKESEGDGGNKENLPMVEIEMPPATTDKPKCFSGVKLLLNGVEVQLDCGFDSETLHTAPTPGDVFDSTSGRTRILCCKGCCR